MIRNNKYKDLNATGLFPSLSDDFGQMMRGFFFAIFNFCRSKVP
jgi:hypothetical protein